MEIIVTENYKLIPEENRFNLQKKRIKNKFKELGSKEIIGTEEVWEDNGYGFTLETAIKNIITGTLEDKEEVISLKEYLFQYKEMLKEIEKLVKV